MNITLMQFSLLSIKFDLISLFISYKRKYMNIFYIQDRQKTSKGKNLIKESVSYVQYLKSFFKFNVIFVALNFIPSKDFLGIS
jgi:hypothetical protein